MFFTSISRPIPNDLHAPFTMKVRFTYIEKKRKKNPSIFAFHLVIKFTTLKLRLQFLLATDKETNSKGLMKLSTVKSDIERRRAPFIEEFTGIYFSVNGTNFPWKKGLHYSSSTSPLPADALCYCNSTLIYNGKISVDKSEKGFFTLWHSQDGHRENVP